MKKFLSLVLAMIMTLSLVTISAGATEYADLTDKDEIQYEEAVAVLNRIGIITGYDDGSFRPETELTRGAAAKIIVSLLIGPDAANALPNNSSPYPDVPASHTFAGVISYCKTAGIISGYGDGTFKPANSLTGFAFAKMLLGAIGYKSDIEGFTDTGWTMNVAKIGNAANLFDRLSFDGSAAVNREQACQLALNTLKATMVEYSGGFNVTAGDATVVGAQTRTYVISNQEYAKNISNRKVTENGNADVTTHWTVEFGEEHFKDLRLDNEHQGKLDDFGRPSNVWSFKKVTIGTFPIEPDFVYTTQVAAREDVKNTKATKIRALGLNGYEVDSTTLLRVNGKDEAVFTDDNNIEEIADYTDNGTVVEVYVSEDDADWICNVVVVKTQLMEVKKLGSDYVTLYNEDDCDKKAMGYNQQPIQEKVEDVEVEDDYYEFLSGLKVGDKVAVIPLTTDGGATYTVAKAYTPETVTGSLDGSKTFAASNVADKDRGVVEVTVGGTAYKVALWNKDLNDANRDIIKVTKKDVTLLLDEFGNAMLAKDIGSTSEYMILGAWRNAVVDGVLVRMASGWDVKGNAISLNVGAEKSVVVTNKYAGYGPGDLLRYTNDGTTANAEWVLSKAGVFDVPGNEGVVNADTLAIKSSNSAVKLADFYLNTDTTKKNDTLVMKHSGVKTIYVAFDDDSDEVDYIEIKDGLQNTTQKELNAQNTLTAKKAEAAVSKLSGGDPTKDSEVQYVVIKTESNDATLKNLGYVYDVDTTNKRDENNDIISDYKVFTVDEEAQRMLSNKNIANRRFVRFTALEEDGMYDLRNYDRRQSGTSVVQATITEVAAPKNNNLLRLSGKYAKMDETTLDGTVDKELPNIQTKASEKGFGGDIVELTEGDAYENLINIKGAKILDLTGNKIQDADDIQEMLEEKDKFLKVDMAFNDNPDNDEFRLTYILVITDVIDSTDKPDEPSTGAVRFASNVSGMGKLSNSSTFVQGTGAANVEATLTVPEWVANSLAATYSYSAPNYTRTAGGDNTVKFTYDVYRNGSKTPYLKNLSDTITLIGLSDTKRSIKFSEVAGQLDSVTAPAGTAAYYKAGDTIEVVITAVEYGAVKVRYFTEGSETPIYNRLLNKPSSPGTMKQTEEIMNVGTATAGDDWWIGLSTDWFTATKADVSITGANTTSDWDLDTATNLGGMAHATDTMAINTAGGIAANGNGYVDITIKRMTETTKYVIEQGDKLSSDVKGALANATGTTAPWDGTGTVVNLLGASVGETLPKKESDDWSDEILVTFADDVTGNGVVTGGTIIEAATTGTPADAVSYKVTLTLTDAKGSHDVVFENVDDSGVKKTHVMESDAKVTGLKVEVQEAIPAIESISVVNNQMTITFNVGVYGADPNVAANLNTAVDLTGSTVTPVGGRSTLAITACEHTAGSKTMVLTFTETGNDKTGNLKAGDAFAIADAEIWGQYGPDKCYKVDAITVSSDAKTASVGTVTWS